MQTEKTKAQALRKAMGTRLRKLRKEHGISLDELSEMLAITPSYLGLIERGDRGLSAERIIDVCRVFKCSADYIITGAERETSDVPVGASNLAKTIDLFLSEDSKQKLAVFIRSVNKG